VSHVIHVSSSHISPCGLNNCPQGWLGFHFTYSESKFYCNNTCIGGALYISCTLCPPLKFFPDFVSCDCECLPSTNLWTYQPGPQHWVLLKAFILAWSCYWLGPKPNVWLVWWSKCEKHGIEIKYKIYWFKARITSGP